MSSSNSGMKPPQGLLDEKSKSLIHFDFSVWSLIVANFVPLFGALIFAWDIRGILIVYWAENLVIGFYNVIKMATVRSTSGENKFFMIPFFLLHFGGFCAIHGMFIVFLTSGFIAKEVSTDFDIMSSAFDWPGPLVFLGLLVNVVNYVWSTFGISVLVPVLGLMISHGISFKQNFIDKREFESTSLPMQMFKPYGRVVLLHVSIIFAAVPVFLFGSPLPLLILLIMIKTAIDIVFHSISHNGGMLKHFLSKTAIVQKLKENAKNLPME